MVMKYCTRCQLTKATNEFYKWKYGKDGFADWCKSCKKDHCSAPEYLAKQRKHKKKWRKVNGSGIYSISLKGTDKVYVGKSKSLKERKGAHFGTLKRNIHHNLDLQNDYNDYGKSAFVFEVLEQVELSKLDEKEVECIVKCILEGKDVYNKKLVLDAKYLRKLLDDQKRIK